MNSSYRFYVDLLDGEVWYMNKQTYMRRIDAKVVRKMDYSFVVIHARQFPLRR